MKRKAIESELAMLNQTSAKYRNVDMTSYGHTTEDTSPPMVSLPNLQGREGADVELRRVMDNFVDLYEKLDTTNDERTKPNYSYTELAYLAMLRSPNFCLPITEIYRYMKSRYLFFKNSTRKHWKNAIRHSLAKTLCFSKIAVGRGTSNTKGLSRSTYLWCIIPSSIVSFARGDYRPSVDRDSGTNTLRWGYFRVNAGQFWDQVGNFMAAKMATFKHVLEISQDAAPIFESQTCQLPSSETAQTSLQPKQEPTHYRHQDSYQEQPTTLTQSSIDARSPTSHVHYDTTTSQMRTPVSYAVYEHPPAPYYHASSPYDAGIAYGHNSFNDPFLSKSLISPNTSASSIESERRTPPSFCSNYDGRDSGNETLGSDASPHDGSTFFTRKQQTSCRMLRDVQISPGYETPQASATHFPDEQELQQLELSPLSGPEVFPLHHNFSQYTYMLGDESPNYFPTQTTIDPAQQHVQQYVLDQSYSEQYFTCGVVTQLSPSYNNVNGNEHLHHSMMPNWTT